MGWNDIYANNPDMQGYIQNIKNGNNYNKPAYNPGAKQPGEKIPAGHRKFSVQNFDPQQMELYQNSFEHVSPDSYLSKLAQGDQETYDQMEAPALRQFNELQGGIASRFSGMGVGGRNSSGFRNTSNAAASDFAQQLQSNRQGLQRQALMDLMGYSNQLMGQRPYDVGLAQKRQRAPGFWKTFGQSLAKSSGESFGKNFNFSGSDSGGGSGGGGSGYTQAAAAFTG